LHPARFSGIAIPYRIMQGEFILIVEDDSLVVKVLTNQLRAYGFQVVAALSAPEAVQAVRAQMPDLMVLDLTLSLSDGSSGLTNGLAFLTMLRRNHPEADFPVVVYTVDDSAKSKARAKAAGVVAVLKKGCPLQELMGVIRKALDERKDRKAEPDRTPSAGRPSSAKPQPE
jgi:CheY-like chemotaxis protein